MIYAQFVQRRRSALLVCDSKGTRRRELFVSPVRPWTNPPKKELGFGRTLSRWLLRGSPCAGAPGPQLEDRIAQVASRYSPFRLEPHRRSVRLGRRMPEGLSSARKTTRASSSSLHTGNSLPLHTRVQKRTQRKLTIRNSLSALSRPVPRFAGTFR